MLYLLAAIGAVAIAVVLWRVFTADQARVPDRPEHDMPGQDAGQRPDTPRGRVIGPDDDPEFLRSIDPDKRDD